MGFKVKTGIAEINNNDSRWADVINNVVNNDANFIVNNVEVKKINIPNGGFHLDLLDEVAVAEVSFLHIYAQTLIQSPCDVIETVAFDLTLGAMVLNVSQFQLCNVKDLIGEIFIDVPALATGKKGLLTIVIGSK